VRQGGQIPWCASGGGLEGTKQTLKGKITVLGFVGTDVITNRGNFFNLNQKIYNKYKGFQDFQMIMVVPLGKEKECQQIIDELELYIKFYLTEKPM
jgi:hypothetical protein